EPRATTMTLSYPCSCAAYRSPGPFDQLPGSRPSARSRASASTSTRSGRRDADDRADRVGDQRRPESDAELAQAREERASAREHAEGRPDPEQREEAEPEADRERGRPATDEVRQHRDRRPDREGDERAERRAPRRAELVGVQPELLADEHVQRGLG